MMMSQRSCLSSEVCIQINSKKYRKSDLEHFPSPKRNASASFIASPLPKKQTNSFSLFWNECTYQVFFFYCRFFINLTYASPWVVTNVWSCVRLPHRMCSSTSRCLSTKCLAYYWMLVNTITVYWRLFVYQRGSSTKRALSAICWCLRTRCQSTPYKPTDLGRRSNVWMTGLFDKSDTTTATCYDYLVGSEGCQDSIYNNTK